MKSSTKIVLKYAISFLVAFIFILVYESGLETISKVHNILVIIILSIMFGFIGLIADRIEKKYGLFPSRIFVVIFLFIINFSNIKWHLFDLLFK